LLTGITLAALGQLVLSGVSVEVQRKEEAKPVATKTAKNETELAVRDGEILEYRLAWSYFVNAATARFKVAGRGNYLGDQAWHLTAELHTVTPVRTLLAVDNQFDSYCDLYTLESLQYESYLNELGRLVRSTKLHLDNRETAAHASGPVMIVP